MPSSPPRTPFVSRSLVVLLLAFATACARETSDGFGSDEDAGAPFPLALPGPEDDAGPASPGTVYATNAPDAAHDSAAANGFVSPAAGETDGAVASATSNSASSRSSSTAVTQAWTPSNAAGGTSTEAIGGALSSGASSSTRSASSFSSFTTSSPPPPDAPVAALPGDLLVTEIMFDPTGPAPESEWFEVTDVAATPRLLSGLTIVDGYGDAATIPSAPPVVVYPGQPAVLVRDTSTALANGIPASAIACAYGTGLADDEGIELQAGPYSEIALWSGTTELVDLTFGAWDLDAYGQSIELAVSVTDAATSESPDAWCYAAAPWADGSDWGTPGAPNDCE